nr:FAD-linked oxidase C-terminal domain-containing protein [Oscillatoria laete-virens]
MDSGTLESHAGDKWFARHLPEAVAFPRSTAQVAHIMAFAWKNKIPVTTRGAGHGYVGGCVPARGGIVVSTARMNRLVEINPRDGVAVVQPGLITKSLDDAAAERGWYYPPDPASYADSSIGGNIATNAGGPHCLKYGVTKNYVLGLEVVLADGTVVRVGGRCHKNKTGFNLAELFVGSEGLLGVVTEATVRLIPRPPQKGAMAVSFKTMPAAARCVDAILDAGHLPAALELADEWTLRAAREYLGSDAIPKGHAFLLVELDGRGPAVRAELAELRKLLGDCGGFDIRTALGEKNCDRLWNLRRQFSQSLKATGLHKLNEDIVVPRSKLPALFEFTGKLQRTNKIPVACFGHAGDGNIHVNIMIDAKCPEQRRKSDRMLDALFARVIRWGGAITGEHGIGLAKKPWWPLAADQSLRKLHRLIKNALDPRDILNPGKFI